MGVDAQMLVRVPRAVPRGEVRLVGNKLCGMFGPENFLLWEGRHVLCHVEEFDQDGPTLYPDDGETFLKVELRGRYYGVGYERGDYPFYYMLAEALERLIPGCEVWYGGDSSGVLAEPFGREAREKLLDHFMQVQHEPYARHFDDHMQKEPVLNPVCPLCELQMVRCGWGGNYAAFSCACGERLVIRGKKETWTTAEERREKESAIRAKALDLIFKLDPALREEWHEVLS